MQDANTYRQYAAECRPIGEDNEPEGWKSNAENGGGLGWPGRRSRAHPKEKDGRQGPAPLGIGALAGQNIRRWFETRKGRAAHHAVRTGGGATRVALILRSGPKRREEWPCLGRNGMWFEVSIGMINAINASGALEPQIP